MKNACVTVVAGIALVALLPTAEAQTAQGGFKVGFTFANVPTLAEESDNEGVGSRYRTGVALGGFATIRITDWMAFQPEVFYTQKGVEFDESTFTNELKVHTDYVDVPVLLRFQQTSGRGVYALVGPSLNFNVRAKTKAGDIEEDFKDEVEAFEAGVVVGMGFQLADVAGGWLGPAGFLIEVRFSEGLTNIFRNPAASDDSYRNRSLAIVIGARIR